MARPDLLTLARIERRRDNLAIDFTLDGRPFRKRYRWAGVDLPALERRHGRELLERIYFHLAALEAIPFAGLRPRRLEFGSWRRFATAELEALWRRLLRGEGEAVRATHSCSVRKPWCETCPKCAYVGLGFHAYLDPEVVAGLFAGKLFDRPENLEHYRGLLGLGRPKPFECVGEIGESRLAMELCRRRGATGQAVDEWARHASGFDPRAALDRYLRVDEAATGGLPEEIARTVLPRLREGAAEARRRVEAWL